MKRLFELVPSPPPQPKANSAGPAPALIEGNIPLPAPFGLRSRSWLAALYSDQHLSAREISRAAAASRSGVLNALERFGIPPHVNGHQRTGPLPFGFDYQDHNLAANSAEQTAIRMMREQRTNGLDALRKSSYVTITLDLSMAVGITSSAIGKLVSAHRELRAQNRSFRINGGSETLYGIFQKIKLDTLMQITR